MKRTPLIVVLLIALGTGFLFALYPTIDLSIARLVYEATNVSNGQVPRLLHLTDSILRKVGTWIEILLIVPPIIALLVKLILPQTRMFVPRQSDSLSPYQPDSGAWTSCECRTQKPLGTAETRTSVAVWWKSAFRSVVAADRRLPQKLFLRIGRSIFSVFECSPCGTNPSAMATVGLRRCHFIREHYFALANSGGWSFLVGRDLCGCIYLPHCLASVCDHLPVEGHAAGRQHDRESARAFLCSLRHHLPPHEPKDRYRCCPTPAPSSDAQEQLRWARQALPERSPSWWV